MREHQVTFTPPRQLALPCPINSLRIHADSHVGGCTLGGEDVDVDGRLDVQLEGVLAAGAERLEADDGALVLRLEAHLELHEAFAAVLKLESARAARRGHQ